MCVYATIKTYLTYHYISVELSCYILLQSYVTCFINVTSCIYKWVNVTIYINYWQTYADNLEFPTKTTYIELKKKIIYGKIMYVIK